MLYVSSSHFGPQVSSENHENWKCAPSKNQGFSRAEGVVGLPEEASMTPPPGKGTITITVAPLRNDPV